VRVDAVVLVLRACFSRVALSSLLCRVCWTCVFLQVVVFAVVDVALFALALVSIHKGGGGNDGGGGGDNVDDDAILSSRHRFLPNAVTLAPRYGSPLVLALEDEGVLTDCTIRTSEPAEPLGIDIRETEIPGNIIMKVRSLCSQQWPVRLVYACASRQQLIMYCCDLHRCAVDAVRFHEGAVPLFTIPHRIPSVEKQTCACMCITTAAYNVLL
jgi:hypothetical protein